MQRRPRGGKLLLGYSVHSTDNSICATTDNNCSTVDDSSAAGGGECVLRDNNLDLLCLLVHRDTYLSGYLDHHVYPLTYLLPDHHQHQRLHSSYRLRIRPVELPIAPREPPSVCHCGGGVGNGAHRLCVAGLVGGGVALSVGLSAISEHVTDHDAGADRPPLRPRLAGSPVLSPSRIGGDLNRRLNAWSSWPDV